MSDGVARQPEDPAAGRHEGEDATPRREPIRPFARLNPLRSLTSRFIATLVCGVLFTSLAVTWISIRATEPFLRAKIEHKFVTVLSDARQRLELWHKEREFEIATLASSATLARAMALPRSGGESASELANPALNHINLDFG